ncbi:hypothetical protein SASPL_121265 [Salvia splendens]|uniref:Bifunctional inhibitor/plant lipid transfer protein/seed storage helical domain-containing protein n=1 Tax=Salvia splendens TaxID=180675 RepID=A0A8X8XWZ9_SALSN|nr:hypothetical protein SASPL_121265 [Salvia splendens]
MLLPCQDYLVNPSAKLTARCCQAASKLNSLVHGRADLKDMRTCLKQAAAALHVIANRAKSLPDQCHIQVPVPLDPNIDSSDLCLESIPEEAIRASFIELIAEIS